MDRRTFIAGISIGILAAPLAAQAQQASTRTIGFLAAGSAATTRDWIPKPDWRGWGRCKW